MSSHRAEAARLALAAALAVGSLAACATPEGGVRGGPSSRKVVVAAARSSTSAGLVQSELVRSAQGFVGARTITVGRRTFPADCTGLVLAIYYANGIDLERVFPRYSGNGVLRLHSALQDSRLVSRDPRPDAADLVFWDNTYDANGDGKWNDSLTHVGMVMEVARDGTIVYVHYNYRRGVVLERMNLARPSVASDRGVPLNSPLRMAGTFKPGEPMLSGELFHDFGRAWKLPL